MIIVSLQQKSRPLLQVFRLVRQVNVCLVTKLDPKLFNRLILQYNKSNLNVLIKQFKTK